MGACGVTFSGDRCKPFFFAYSLLGGVRSLPLLSPKATKNAVTVNRLRVIPELWKPNLSVSNVPGAASTGRLGDGLESDAGTLIQQKIGDYSIFTGFWYGPREAFVV